MEHRIAEYKGGGRKKRDNQILDVLCIPASDADAAAFNPKGIKTILPKDLVTIFIEGNPVFSNGPRHLAKNSSDCTILDN